MTLDTLIMIAGGFVATLPFLGLPNSWDTVLLFCAGVGIVALGILVRRQKPHTDSGDISNSRSHEDVPAA